MRPSAISVNFKDAVCYRMYYSTRYMTPRLPSNLQSPKDVWHMNDDKDPTKQLDQDQVTTDKLSDLTESGNRS